MDCQSIAALHSAEKTTCRDMTRHLGAALWLLHRSVRSPLARSGAPLGTYFMKSLSNRSISAPKRARVFRVSFLANRRARAHPREPLGTLKTEVVASPYLPPIV